MMNCLGIKDKFEEKICQHDIFLNILKLIM